MIKPLVIACASISLALSLTPANAATEARSGPMGDTSPHLLIARPATSYVSICGRKSMRSSYSSRECFCDVTYCAGRGRFAAMNSAARLLTQLHATAR